MFFEKNNGITLIVLIVTVIIMIIFASIFITFGLENLKKSSEVYSENINSNSIF